MIHLLSHGFNANAPLISEKDENLVRWVIVGCGKEVKLVPTARRARTTLVNISQ